MAAHRRRRGPRLTATREIPPGDLRDLGDLDHPFVRHQVDPGAVTRAWVHGRAAVLVGPPRPRPGWDPSQVVVTGLGPADELTPLMAAVAPLSARPSRLTVEEPAAPPPSWSCAETWRWHWMLAGGPVPSVPGAVVELDAAGPGSPDAAAVDALLDAANPGSFARPGSGARLTWLGVRDPQGRGLLAAGALEQMADRTGHLRGVSVRPDARGRGLGTALSAALAARALAHGSGVATLGVYADNTVAIGLYRRIGFAVRCTFVSGEMPPG